MTKLYAGLDVSLEMTSVCVVDEDGRICLEAKVASEPTALVESLRALDGSFVRVGLEAGPLSQWLFFGLTDAGLPAVCIETRHLKGAIGATLGLQAAGLFSPDDALAEQLEAAAARSAERVWRMPMWEECEADLRSDTADVVNSAPRGEGGAITAAVFLKRFARGYPWAHLDIASTAWTIADRPHETRGPTGYGARLLLEWLSARADAARGA